MNCKICGKEVISIKALSQHIRFHNITSKEYYDKFLLTDITDGKCKNCNKDTKFLSLTRGYQLFCNLKCSNSCIETKNKISLKKKEWWTNTDNDELITDMKIKIKESVIKKHLDGCYDNLSEKLSNAQKNRWKLIIENLNIDTLQLDSKIKNFKVVGEYNGAHNDCNFKCLNCNYIFIDKWNYIQQGKTCPNCGKQNGRSTYEDEIIDFLKSLNIKIIKNDKSVIGPKEIDIYIPELKIGIEFDGLYWHSDEWIDSKYHVTKTNLCLSKGIQLIHIFEDEWLFKKDIVKERIKRIINKCDSKKIYARNCEIKEISSQEKNEFLEQYHIQGKDASNIKLGAFYNNELVSVMTFSKGNIAKGSKYKSGVWELNRFCSNYNYHVIGIASKLLTHFKRNYKFDSIFSYADRRWSVGNLYEKLGFILEKITQPNYWYISNYKRIHRFNLRKTKNDPINIPENILRKQEGYCKIWDCGNYKYYFSK